MRAPREAGEAVRRASSSTSSPSRSATPCTRSTCSTTGASTSRRKEEVDKARSRALKYKDKYKIRQVLPVVDQHGVYSFYMEDLDHNREIQYYPGFQNEDLFDFGDRFSMDDGAEVGELKELNIKTTA